MRGVPKQASRITVREAVVADATRVAELSAQLGYPVESDAIRTRLERIVGREDMAVLVAEAGPGEPVGWVNCAELEILEYGRRCEILGLVVDGRRRRQGIGRLLVDAVESWAAARGLGEVAVRSNVVRPEAHPFYEGMGYARVKTQHSYRKRLGSRGGGDVGP